jgi:hypothetical protein
MEEIRILLAQDSVFYVGKRKVSVKIPTGAWMAKSLGMLSSLGEIGRKILNGKIDGSVLFVIFHILNTVKVSGRPGLLKAIWFYRLDYKTQVAFIEKWMDAIDIPAIKDFFARWGLAKV